MREERDEVESSEEEEDLEDVEVEDKDCLCLPRSGAFLEATLKHQLLFPNANRLGWSP